MISKKLDSALATRNLLRHLEDSCNIVGRGWKYRETKRRDKGFDLMFDRSRLNEMRGCNFNGIPYFLWFQADARKIKGPVRKLSIEWIAELQAASKLNNHSTSVAIYIQPPAGSGNRFAAFLRFKDQVDSGKAEPPRFLLTVQEASSDSLKAWIDRLGIDRGLQSILEERVPKIGKQSISEATALVGENRFDDAFEFMKYAIDEFGRKSGFELSIGMDVTTFAYSNAMNPEGADLERDQWLRSAAEGLLDVVLTSPNEISWDFVISTVSSAMVTRIDWERVGSVLQCYDFSYTIAQITGPNKVKYLVDLIYRNLSYQIDIKNLDRSSELALQLTSGSDGLF